MRASFFLEHKQTPPLIVGRICTYTPVCLYGIESSETMILVMYHYILWYCVVIVASKFDYYYGGVVLVSGRGSVVYRRAVITSGSRCRHSS
jgi:hypothetical protein